MSSSSSSLRPQPITHSPTSSVSSQNTTPTSPHFAHHLHHVSTRHPYASSSHLEPQPRHQSSLHSISTIATTTSSVNNVIHHPRPPTPPMLHPPAGKPFMTYLKGWDQQELTAFLNLYRCGQYASAFQRHDIDGKVLLDLDMAALKEIGIKDINKDI